MSFEISLSLGSQRTSCKCIFAYHFQHVEILAVRRSHENELEQKVLPTRFASLSHGLLKFINNLSILNKEKYDRDSVWISGRKQIMTILSPYFSFLKSVTAFPNNLKLVKNTRVVFSTLFSMFGYPDETLSLVFDIELYTE